MPKNILLSLIFILVLTLAASCSSGDGFTVAPGTDERDSIANSTGTQACLGLWQVSADKTTGQVDVVRLRSADQMINVLTFMEPPPLVFMDLDWPDLVFGEGTLDVGVILTHPIPDNTFMGFDVRGVCFGPEVTNADGLTIAMSPEVFSGVPFGYKDGLLGAPDSHAGFSGVAGYKYYCLGLSEDDILSEYFSDVEALDTRGVMPPESKIQRNYILDWNDTDLNYMVFNYAIYANYDWPVGDPPFDIESFERTTANSAEAFCCSIIELDCNLWYSAVEGGGEISLQVEVWDWQGDISTVSMQSYSGNGAFPDAAYFDLVGPGNTAYSTIYEIHDVAGSPNSGGIEKILITVTDVKTYGECWFLDLLPESNGMYDEPVYNCWMTTAEVLDYQPVAWSPTVGLVGSNLKARATNEDTIVDSKSTYDSSSEFLVTGGNATGGMGVISYEYYVSTSNGAQVGTAVGWVPFTFDGTGNFTVEWESYMTIAPSVVYLWVRATDGFSTSNPALCIDGMRLSNVAMETNTFNTGWWLQSGYGPYITMYGDYIYIYRWYASYSSYYGRYISRVAPVTCQGTNTMEYHVRTDWYQQYEPDGSYVQMRYGAAYTSLSSAIGPIYKVGTQGTVRSHSWDYDGQSYVGLLAYQTSYIYDYRFYIDNVAVYNDP